MRQRASATCSRNRAGQKSMLPRSVRPPSAPRFYGDCCPHTTNRIRPWGKLSGRFREVPRSSPGPASAGSFFPINGATVPAMSRRPAYRAFRLRIERHIGRTLKTCPAPSGAFPGAATIRAALDLERAKNACGITVRSLLQGTALCCPKPHPDFPVGVLVLKFRSA
jgi:hypothetical protein